MDIGFGLDHYERRTSSDGGSTWSPPVNGSSITVAAEGQTLVQFRAVDTAGNASAWTPASSTPASTIRIDRTAPVDPTVGITPPGWHNAAAITVFAGGSTDALGGVDHYQFRSSADNGVTWTTPVNGETGVVTGEGQTVVQFRAVDGAGNLSAWAPATASPSNIVRIDRTAPTLPTVTGGQAGWQTAASVAVSASGGSDGQAGIDHYESRTSTDGGATWSATQPGPTVNVTAEGETLVQFRSVDAADNPSAWSPAAGTAAATVRLDRSAPGDPVVSGGSTSWQNLASVTVTGSGAFDPLAGIATYEHRTSRDGGTTWSAPQSGATIAVSAEDETLVQFRATDAAGNTSGWAPSSATSGSIVRLDRTTPTVPTVTGGSLTWQSVGSVALDGSGGTDGLSGVAGYEFRTTTDGGTSWSAPSPGTTGLITAEGQSAVQFRTVDQAGNASAWAPSVPDAASTVRIDRTPPSSPAASGGALAWQNLPSIVLNGNTAVDPMSGVVSYEFRLSTDGGASWGVSGAGTTASPSAEGETIIQFRATDAAGNTSAWGRRRARPAPPRASTGRRRRLRRSAAGRCHGSPSPRRPCPRAAPPTSRGAASPATSSGRRPTGAPRGAAHSPGPRPRSPPRARRSSSSARRTSPASPPRGCPACPTPAAPFASTAPCPPPPPSPAGRPPGRTWRR